MTRRAILGIATGTVVMLLTGGVAWSFLVAATWSSLHGGMSQLVLALLSVVALATPPGCALLAGWAVYESRSTAALHPDQPIPLKCPHCGCSLKHAAQFSATQTEAVAECRIHGPLHVG